MDHSMHRNQQLILDTLVLGGREKGGVGLDVNGGGVKSARKGLTVIGRDWVKSRVTESVSEGRYEIQ